MITNLDAACAEMKQRNLIAKGKALDEYKLFRYRQKLFRSLLAPLWDEYRRSRTKPGRRAGILAAAWASARRRITPDMSVEEALTVVDTERYSLTIEVRAKPTHTVRPPDIVSGKEPPRPRKPGESHPRRLGFRIERDTLYTLRVKLYRMLVSARWVSYSHARDRWPLLNAAWVQAYKMMPESMPLTEARETLETIWAGMSEKERRRDLRHLGDPGPAPEPPAPEDTVSHSIGAFIAEYCEPSEGDVIDLDTLRRRYNGEYDERITAIGIRRMVSSEVGRERVDERNLIGYRWSSTRE